MSMYGYDVSFHDYGFSDPSITGSIYENSISPMAAAIDYDDELYVRRRPPPRPKPKSNSPSSPPNHRHDGTSPLPLGMDWNLAPLIWEGRNSVWPHELHKGWSYCVTIPSLSSEPSASSSDTVFYGVKVGIQSPEGITTTRTVPRRFSDFLKLYSELKKEFPKKNLPPTPPKTLVKSKSKKVLIERISALECWMTKLLSDIDVSRTAPVAIFLDLEAAARQACCELNENEPADVDNSCTAYETSDTTTSSEKENYEAENASERGIIINNNSNGENNMEIEEIRRKCIELEFGRAFAESMKEAMNQHNELLIRELDDAKEQIEILKKEKQDMELNSKSLTTSSYLELKQEFSKCLEEKLELEKEKKRWEDGKAFLHECENICDRLKECDVSFLVEEDKSMSMVDDDLSDAIDVLETSDTQIGLLLSEAKVVGEDEDDELRKLLGDVIIENGKLRRQVNSLIRRILSNHGTTTLKENDEEWKEYVK